MATPQPQLMNEIQDAPEFPSPTITDSRRLLGANLYSDRLGVVLEVRCPDANADVLMAAWATAARELTDALEWKGVNLHTRREPGGATLFLAGPMDVLMTATDVNEQAWVIAEGATLLDAELVVRLKTAATAEQAAHPTLADLHAAARARGLCATFDEDLFTVGSGDGACSWPMTLLPRVADVPWDAAHDVPIALVTGSNGKTTTTRLVAAMWRTVGRTAGWCCSDGVWVGSEQLASGDFSGPGGARTVLRDTRASAIVLETARGGMLRRGLAVSRADAAIVTNISADHFGEYGITDEHGLAEVKLVVARVLGATACLVLNADDAELVALAGRVGSRIGWFSVNHDHPVLAAHARGGGNAATIREGRAMLYWNETWHDLGSVHDMPLTLGGAARYNTRNVLGSALLAVASGVPVTAVRQTLATFGASLDDNPGRLQVLHVGGVTILVDYAHNPDGLASLCDTARTFPARRRVLVLGQAGNRDDEQLRALVRSAWNVMPFDEVVIKEMPKLLRGRALGDLPRVFASELARLGLTLERIHIAESELAAVHRAVALSSHGDLIVCPLHTEQVAVLSWFQRLTDASWSAGSPFPPTAQS